MKSMYPGGVPQIMVMPGGLTGQLCMVRQLTCRWKWTYPKKIGDTNICFKTCTDSGAPSSLTDLAPQKIFWLRDQLHRAVSEQPFTSSTTVCLSKTAKQESKCSPSRYWFANVCKPISTVNCTASAIGNSSPENQSWILAGRFCHLSHHTVNSTSWLHASYHADLASCNYRRRRNLLPVPTDPIEIFNFAVDAYWRANTPVLSWQIENKCSAQQIEDNLPQIDSDRGPFFLVSQQHWLPVAGWF